MPYPSRPRWANANPRAPLCQYRRHVEVRRRERWKWPILREKDPIADKWFEEKATIINKWTENILDEYKPRGKRTLELNSFLLSVRLHSIPRILCIAAFCFQFVYRLHRLHHCELLRNCISHTYRSWFFPPWPAVSNDYGRTRWNNSEQQRRQICLQHLWNIVKWCAYHTVTSSPVLAASTRSSSIVNKTNEGTDPIAVFPL